MYIRRTCLNAIERVTNCRSLKLLDHQNEYSVETRLEARQTKMYVCTLEELYSSSISCSLYTSVGESELG